LTSVKGTERETEEPSHVLSNYFQKKKENGRGKKKKQVVPRGKTPVTTKPNDGAPVLRQFLPKNGENRNTKPQSSKVTRAIDFLESERWPEESPANPKIFCEKKRTSLIQEGGEPDEFPIPKTKKSHLAPESC